MSKLLDRTLSLVLTIAALAIAANLLAQWVGISRAAADTWEDQERQAPVVKDWRDGLQFGLPLYGSANAPVVIMEFSDFECPFCKQFHEVLHQTALADSTRVRVVYIEGALAFGRQRGVEATPTIWINGNQFRGGLARETLDRLIDEIGRKGR